MYIIILYVISYYIYNCLPHFISCICCGYSINLYKYYAFRGIHHFLWCKPQTVFDRWILWFLWHIILHENIYFHTLFFLYKIVKYNNYACINWEHENAQRLYTRGKSVLPEFFTRYFPYLKATGPYFNNNTLQHKRKLGN